MLQNFTATSFDDNILEVVAVFGSVQLGISRVFNLQRHRIAQVHRYRICTVNSSSSSSSSSSSIICSSCSCGSSNSLTLSMHQHKIAHGYDSVPHARVHRVLADMEHPHHRWPRDYTRNQCHGGAAMHWSLSVAGGLSAPYRSTGLRHLSTL